MISNWSFKRRMFVYYSVMVSVIIFLFISALAFYLSNVFEKQVTQGSEQLLQKISEQLDGLIFDMERACVNILSNVDIKKYFYNPEQVSQLGIEEYRNINNSITSITGVFNPVHRIVIFNFDYRFAVSPQPIDNAGAILEKGIDANPVFVQLKNNDGSLVLLPPHYDNWSSAAVPVPVFSLGRKILDPNGTEYGYIEVQQTYNSIKKLFNIDLPSNSKFFILDSSSRLFYPSAALENIDWKKDFDIYIKHLSNKTSQYVSLKNSGGKKEILFYRHAPFTNFTIALVYPQEAVFKSVSSIRNIFIAGAILLLAITLFVLNVITRRLSYPIEVLTKSVKQVSLNNLSINLESIENVNELQMLDISFKNMFRKLELSIARLAESKQREASAYFCALQSQINPHFIHNTLALIGAMAKQPDQQQKVVEMCRLLSSQLHYTTSPVISIVTLESELEYTRNYLMLMKFRYEEHFDFDISVDERLKTLKMPKISLQPFIENSIVHGLIKVYPPWHIKITGHYFEDGWEISIADNGCGIDDEVLSSLNQKISRAWKANDEPGNVFSAESSKGLGIVNTYIRLKFHFGDCFNLVFSRPERGTVITFGCKSEKQEVVQCIK